MPDRADDRMMATHCRDSRSLILLLITGILLIVFNLAIDNAAYTEIIGELFSRSGALSALEPLAVLLRVFSYPIGTSICIWCAGHFILRRAKPLLPPEILVPMLCNLCVFAQWLPLLSVPRGTSIRPMFMNAVIL